MADFKNLKGEWVKAYEEHKADGEGAAFVGVSALITAGTLLVLLGIVAIGIAILKSIFWYAVGAAVVYALGVKFFNFPVPAFAKKFIK